MSGEDGEVDDGPPVLVAFEYPPDDNGNELPLDNEDLPETAAANDVSASEDDAEDSRQDDLEEGQEVGPQDSQQESKRRGSKRRHHRRSSRHRKAKEKPSLPTKSPAVIEGVPNPAVAPVDYLTSGVGDWASLFVYQQYPSGAGDDIRASKLSESSSPSKLAKVLPQRNDPKDKLLTNQGKSQYDVDDADPYATPEGSEDEEIGVQSTKEPLAQAAIGNNYPLEVSSNDNVYQHEQSFPPRKRLREESFGDRSSASYNRQPRDEGNFYGREDRGGFRQGYDDNADEGYGGRRGSRSPGDHWRNRRDRGMRRGRMGHGGMGPRRPRNDYDQMPPPHPDAPAGGYESHYDDHYNNQGPDSYHHQQPLPPPQQQHLHHQDGNFQPPPPPPPANYRGGPPPPQEMNNNDGYDDMRGMPRRYPEEDMSEPAPRNDRRRDRDGGRGGRRRGDRGERNERAPPAQNPQNDRPGLICKFYREGNCLKGANCNFAHILPSEIKRKPELCKFYLGGYCIKGNDCDYLHEQFPCKFFHTSGNCRNGDHCRFSHAPLDEDGQKLLDKAVAAWGGERTGPGGEQQEGGEQQFYPPDDQQQQPPQQYHNNGGGPPPPNQSQPPHGFYGVDSLMGPGDQNNFASPPQNRPPFMPPPPQGGYPGEHDRPPYEPPPPFHNSGDFMPPPPPNFPPMPPPYQGPPGGPQHPVPPYYSQMPNDLNSPPQFRPLGMPPGPGSSFPPSSPSAGYQPPSLPMPNAPMPGLPPTLSAEQIHHLASQSMPGMPGLPSMPPYSQTPPDHHLQQSSSSALPNFALPPGSNSETSLAGATSPSSGSNARDPRLNVNRTSSDAGGERRPVRYKLISVLIPPPVPLSLALRLDPLDPIIRLDPRLRKVFGLTNP